MVSGFLRVIGANLSDAFADFRVLAKASALKASSKHGLQRISRIKSYHKPCTNIILI